MADTPEGVRELRDEDRLPWLEGADPDYREGPSPWRIVALVIVGLTVVAGIVYAYMWLSAHRKAPGTGEMIEAPSGDYKVPPDQTGGMKVAGEGDTRFPVSKGETADGQVDVDAMPEAPVQGRKVPDNQGDDGKSSKTVLAEVPKSSGEVKAEQPTEAPALVSKPTGQNDQGSGGSVVQIGSFPDQSGAQAAWKRYSDRFSYLANLTDSIEQAKVNGSTVYRLRVNTGSASQAKEICGKLKVAGEACYVPKQ